MKAFSYIRVSTNGQLSGDGFPRQIAAINQYATANNFQVVREYQEKGVCGATELDGREAFCEMLADMEEQGVSVILIERLDRLARDLMVQETIIADVRKRGFQIVSTVEPDLCSDDPTRKLMRQIMGAIAEYDRAMIVAKLRSARLRKKAKFGQCEGVKAFGKLPGERKTLERMMQLHAQGLDSVQIAVRLGSEGYRPRKGGNWNSTVVYRMVQRELKAVEALDEAGD